MLKIRTAATTRLPAVTLDGADPSLRPDKVRFMPETPCPQGDNGICSYPDRVLLVNGGQLSVVTGTVAEMVLPEFGPGTVSELEWMSGDEYDEVADLVLDVMRSRSPRENEFRPAAWMHEELENQLSQVEKRLSELSVENGVIVRCSCGHTWVTSS